MRSAGSVSLHTTVSALDGWSDGASKGTVVFRLTLVPCVCVSGTQPDCTRKGPRLNWPYILGAGGGGVDVLLWLCLKESVNVCAVAVWRLAATHMQTAARVLVQSLVVWNSVCM